MIAGLKPYVEYRDSGISWLGDIPSHWSVERAKWLFFKMNRPSNKDDEVITCFRDGTVTLRKNRRLRGFTESINETGYQGIHEGDLVIHMMDAFAGAVGVSDSNGKGTPVYIVCQSKNGVNPHYYSHLIRHMAKSEWILALAKGIRERSTDFRYEMFETQWVPVPPSDEQILIVRFIEYEIGHLDQAIRAKRKVIALLNEQKQAIIHRAVTRGLDPTISLKLSSVPEVGYIPEHWKELLNQVVFREAIRPYGGSSEIPLSLSQRDGLIPTDDLKERTLRTASYAGWKVVIPGDLVLNRFKAHLGVFFSANLRGIVSFHYGVFAPKTTIHTKYYEYLYHTTPFKAIYAGRSNGMTVGLQNLSNQNFYSVRTIVPPYEEQVEIVRYVESVMAPLNNATQQLDKAIKLLYEFRSRLIADTVTGKLDVRELAAHLPLTTSPSIDLDNELSIDESPSDQEIDDEEAEA